MCTLTSLFFPGKGATAANHDVVLVKMTTFLIISFSSLTYPNFCLDRDGLTPAGGKIVGPGICPPVRGELRLKE